jgi:ElaB/YqjD/DUF883 family membrane-anchored ribosome-binding protein
MNVLANSTADLAGSVHHMVDEAERFLKAAARSGDATFDAARGRFAEQVRDARAQLDELEGEVAHELRRAAHRADRAVHAHPYRAIGVAAAAGLLIGLLAGRRW